MSQNSLIALFLREDDSGEEEIKAILNESKLGRHQKHRLAPEGEQSPITKARLEDLMKRSRISVELVLEIDPQSRSSYLVFAKYDKGRIVRQVFTQRGAPRRFKDLRRALAWGKQLGFSRASVRVDYDLYQDGEAA